MTVRFLTLKKIGSSYLYGLEKISGFNRHLCRRLLHPQFNVVYWVIALLYWIY